MNESHTMEEIGSLTQYQIIKLLSVSAPLSKCWFPLPNVRTSEPPVIFKKKVILFQPSTNNN